jgi:hypothetical protein
MNLKPSSIRMSLLSSFLFVGALLLSPKASLAAPLVITKSDYNLTYPDGWMAPIASGDTSYFAMNAVLSSALAYGIALPMDNGVDPSYYAHLFTASYTHQFLRTDSANVVLGGKTFVMTAYKDTASDEDSTNRIRIYSNTKGNYLFVSWLIYDLEDAAAIAQQEAALASLNITAITGIRNVSVAGKTNAPQAGFDIQGRSRKPAEIRNPSTAIFLKQ